MKQSRATYYCPGLLRLRLAMTTKDCINFGQPAAILPKD